MARRAPLATPAGFSPRSEGIWRAETKWSRGAGRLALLEIGLRALDHAEELRAQVAREGATAVTARTGVTRLHPLLKLAAAEQAVFLKVAKLLRLNEGGDL